MQTSSLVCVPTPLSADGGPDLGPVEMAARTIGAHVRSGALVILESTTYPGTTEEIFAPLVLGDRLFGRPGRAHRLPTLSASTQGTPSTRVENTPKVVGGLTPSCGGAARPFYSHFIETVVEAQPVPVRPRWPSCSRTPSGTSTSRWSTRCSASATSWTSTFGTRSTAPRRSPSATWHSAPAPALVATASPLTPRT